VALTAGAAKLLGAETVIFASLDTACTEVQKSEDRVPLAAPPATKAGTRATSARLDSTSSTPQLALSALAIVPSVPTV